ncbi:MAG: ribonuclease HI family protein [Methanolinea sp.]|jgi:ribonuclease HI|nr:ribonuclease HI family protein [Methanolinea sp.]
MDEVFNSYTDGASRGNPGPAACAFLLIDPRGKIIARDAVILGRRTNNEAEYQAVINSLQKAASLSARRVLVHSDSQLVIRQLKGEYQVRKPHLRAMYVQVKDLEQRFLSVDYSSVPREDPWIREADRLCNEALDSANS